MEPLLKEYTEDYPYTTRKRPIPLRNHMFIVTNMRGDEKFIVNFYCGRGNMEKTIKECKDDFDSGAVRVLFFFLEARE